MTPKIDIFDRGTRSWIATDREIDLSQSLYSVRMDRPRRNQIDQEQHPSGYKIQVSDIKMNEVLLRDLHIDGQIASSLSYVSQTSFWMLHVQLDGDINISINNTLLFLEEQAYLLAHVGNCKLETALSSARFHSSICFYLSDAYFNHLLERVNEKYFPRNPIHKDGIEMYGYLSNKLETLLFDKALLLREDLLQSSVPFLDTLDSIIETILRSKAHNK